MVVAVQLFLVCGTLCRLVDVIDLEADEEYIGGACHHGVGDADVGQDVGLGGPLDASRRASSHRCGAVFGTAVDGAGLVGGAV